MMIFLIKVKAPAFTLKSKLILNNNRTHNIQITKMKENRRWITQKNKCFPLFRCFQRMNNFIFRYLQFYNHLGNKEILY